MQPLDPSSFRPSQAQGARALHQATEARNTALVRLATAKRINRAADDPAGLIRSEGLKSQLAALEAETRASERAAAVARTADGALSALSETLVDARAAAVAAANTGGLTDAERNAYATEIASAAEAANRVASTAEFNDQQLFDGDFTITIKDAVLDLPAVYATDLGLESGIEADPSAAVDALDGAIDSIANARGSIGTFERQSRSLARAAQVEFENVAAANSQIEDADFAAEVAAENRAAILQQASVFLLSNDRSNNDRLTDLLG